MAKMKKISFGENLKRILAERSLTLTKISEATGIPMSTLSEWTGGREPKVSEGLIKLCKYLGLSLDEMVMANGYELPTAQTEATAVIQLDGRKYRIRFDRLP